MSNNGFSEDFLWGAAAASAQIEGGWNEGGRTPSIWDMATKKQIKRGETCHTACDHYHRWKEDVALMREMGLKSYRFSISWSRVIPEEGKVNPEGLKFYSDLVDELIANGIEPLGSARVGLQKGRLALGEYRPAVPGVYQSGGGSAVRPGQMVDDT